MMRNWKKKKICKEGEETWRRHISKKKQQKGRYKTNTQKNLRQEQDLRRYHCFVKQGKILKKTPYVKMQKKTLPRLEESQKNKD